MAMIGLEAEEYDRKYSDIALIKRISSYFRPYLRNLVIVVIFLTLYSLTNSLVPVLTRFALNNLAVNQDFVYLLFVLGLILSINLLNWIFNYFRQINSAKMIGGVVLDLRKDATNATLKHDLSFFDKTPTGKIVSRINSDGQDFSQTVELSIELISSIFIIIILIIFMVFINVLLTLAFIISIPLFFMVALSFRKIARKKTLLGQRARANVNSFVKESVSGIQIAKTFRREEKLYKRFNKVNQQSYEVNLKRAWVLNGIFPSLGIVQGVVIALLVYFGGIGVLEGVISGGDLYLFLQSIWLLLFPLFIIASFWPAFQAGLAAAERSFSLIDAEPVVKQNDDIVPGKFEGKIEFKNVTFRYEENKNVLENFSLTIHPGETVAFVGHTGAGKSSIANLIARFYEFQGGNILIDGVDIRDFNLEGYRNQLGFIPQTPFLWGETLENNIKYCCLTATRDEVVDTLDKAGGYDWIEDLSKGLDTFIGERGNLLSMGQRQLVVFARVLLEDPSILILDEATASVDPFTETRIQEAVEEIVEGRTAIIIAHRLWTVRHVDRIIVIDDGKIVEEGTHEKLMDKGGKYAELYNTYFRHQSLEYIEEVKKLE
ncbi:MAG: ATP-binding cassette domain-containing protein [Candidatus Lokiarchaeota archaeon]|nr:ATP-binding cassette domain-containing protein [Candidatus Lokiarchaeota archaeon]MBD3202543.1 ATP-binding cassette domain-containing protein [Candidatus Lokiarchaeota archaeon]